MAPNFQKRAESFLGEEKMGVCTSSTNLNSLFLTWMNFSEIVQGDTTTYENQEEENA